MSLTLEHVSRTVEGQIWIDDACLKFEPGSFNVLLGRTLSGKTSLMRLMAGLDKPDSGRILMNGVDVTQRPVRLRNVSMVYQQFINYPTMTVFENIASPLRQAGASNELIHSKVLETAKMLRIEKFLQRHPLELSGGQQQRTAMARALVKDAELILFDEPLVNLDYKLREELRDELTALFAAGDSTVIYATTEPSEALLLGGYTAVLDRGELLQYGPTADVFFKPKSLRVARAFSDPPMNLIGASATAAGVQLDGGPLLPVALPETASKKLTVGMRASAVRVQPEDGDIQLPGKVELAEISGTDTFVHVDTPVGELVAQLTGVHFFELGEALTLYFNAAHVYVFDAEGLLVLSPVRGGGRCYGTY